MADALSAPAARTLYATRAMVKQQLGDPVLQSSAGDAQIDQLLLTASRAIDGYCGRRFAREAVSEDLPGDGSPYLMVTRCPVRVVTSLLFDSTPVVGAVIDDPEAGFLYLRAGFATSVRGYGPLGGWGMGWTGTGATASAGGPRYHVEYIGGYLVPADDLVTRTVSVIATPATYHDTAGAFPLLVPGDRLLAEGFTAAANNGWKTVVSATATDVVVSEALVTEAAAGAGPSDDRRLTVQTLPPDIQQACVEVVRGLHYSRLRDPTIASKTVGDLSVAYRGGSGNDASLPFTALMLLRPWVRVV